MEDVRNLGPSPLTNTDLFESKHSPYKQIRIAKRTSVNVLYTLISNQERLNVYNSTRDIHKCYCLSFLLEVNKNN